MEETSSPETADKYQQLQEENTRLKALLKQHGISWHEEQIKDSRVPLPNKQPVHLFTDQKVTLFRCMKRNAVAVCWPVTP